MSRLSYLIGHTLIILSLLRAAPAAQSVPTFSLQDVQRLALDRYETIGAAREQVRQAELLRRQAGAAVLPTVSMSTLTTRNFVTGSFSFGGRQIDVVPGVDYNLALTISQPIYAGLRDLKARHQAETGIALAKTGVSTTMQDAVLEATRAYYAVLGAKENVQISARAVGVASEMLRTAESLYRAGEAVEMSVLRARVAQSEARRELLQAENGLELAKQQLALLTGTAEQFDVIRPGRPTVFAQPLPDLIAMGLDRRGELKAIDMQQRVAELEIEKRMGQYWPVVRADATYLRRRSGFPANQLSSVSINASWILFEGGRIAADVAGGRSHLRELQLQGDLLRKQTAQQIRAAYLNIDTLAASVDMLMAQVEFARRNAESTAQAFRVGEATDLDLLEANSTLTRSERQLAMTTYNLDVAIYDLQRAVGTFADDLVASAGLGGAQ